MRRLLLAAVSVLLLGSGCGSASSTGSAEADTPGAASADASAEPTTEPTGATNATYFSRTESDSLNALSNKVWQAGTKAESPKQVEACNKAGGRGFGPYRTCLHGLLDPLSAAVGDLAAEFGNLADREFSTDCAASLRASQKTSSGLQSKLENLLAGYDSDDPKAQKRSAQGYAKTVTSLSPALTGIFQGITASCYSPEDLASINASPSPSP